MDVKPIAGTDLCEFHHVGLQLTGRWTCEHRDGNRIVIGPGDIFDTPPGHARGSHGDAVGGARWIRLDRGGWVTCVAPDDAQLETVTGWIEESTASWHRSGW